MNKLLKFLIVITICLFSVQIAWPMASSNYRMDWSTPASGGGARSSTSYKVNDTTGQSAIGTSSSTSYQLCAGYQCSMLMPPGTPAVFRVDGQGNVYADRAYYGQSFETSSADVAEWVPVSESVEPGDVLELDPDNPRYYRKARGPCSDLIAGVVSTEPGFVLGSRTADSELPTDGSGPETEDSALLALIGVVPVKVTDEGGLIQPGDLLVTSSTPGHAMRWDHDYGSPCNLVGKALESLTEESGIILALLTAH